MMMPIIRRRQAGRLMVAAAVVLGASACASDQTRTGKSPAYLIIDSLTAASGAATTFGSQLNSDVQTLVNRTIGGAQVRVATIFSDTGQATIRLALKNPGSGSTPTAPSTLNEITLTRYHVTFRRADGRNTPGVDVPYGFDGGVTATVGASTVATVGFEMVRHTMKQEPPLLNLVGGGGAIQINTIAEVTFYGRDQAGNEVSVTGTISVNFADFGDPS